MLEQTTIALTSASCAWNDARDTQSSQGNSYPTGYYFKIEALILLKLTLLLK